MVRRTPCRRHAGWSRRYWRRRRPHVRGAAPARWLEPGAVILIRQVVDLIDAEHRISAQERNGPFDFVAMLVGLGLGDLVGIDHHRSALAFADVAAEFERLLERHPDRRRETARDGFRPQQHDVDALIGHPVMAQRPRDASSRVGRIPWLDPGPHAALEIGDDAICDARVDIGARVLFPPAHF